MFKDILAIAGKPGLNKMIKNSGNALIVESLSNGKRFQAFSNMKIISLSDISIYTEEEDMPLEKVFKKIYDKYNGENILGHKSSSAEITAFFEDVLPEYDEYRVYVSDMRKVIQWYNTLNEKGMLVFNEEATEEPQEEIENSEKETETETEAKAE